MSLETISKASRLAETSGFRGFRGLGFRDLEV